MTVQPFEVLQKGYANLWAAAKVRPEHQEELNKISDKLKADQRRYAAIGNTFNIPWWVIAIIDQLEGDGGCRTHLFNGDSLKERTTHVPAGQPRTGSPPFTWEASAMAAVKYDGLDQIKSWTVERALFEWECHYNGRGYYKYGVNSPYLWCFTTEYGDPPNVGKFTSDGHFNSTYISTQAGCAAILKVMVPDAAAKPPDPTVTPEQHQDVLKQVFGKIVPGQASRSSIVQGLNALFANSSDQPQPTLVQSLNKLFGG